MGFYGDYPKYVTVAEKRLKAEKSVQKLRKKDPNITPIHIAGRAIAKTWWGKSWCDNLELYADFANRIDRGRSYVRHGAVLDLRINEGKVNALVQGSTSRPYKVEVRINPLTDTNWQDVVKACTGKIDSLQELAAGKFPKALAALFTSKGTGLFPSPQEIHFDCSCPDGAWMCKHVAAVLYGIGARLDDDSELFFTLRKVKMSELITSSIAKKSQDMMKAGSSRRSRRVIVDTDLTDKFGVDIEGSSS